MRVAVFADVHAHLDALVAVLAGALAARVDELWFLGDVVGRGPDPERTTGLIRAHCSMALAGNHDYAATGRLKSLAYGDPSSAGQRSIALAAERLQASGDYDWLRSRKPAGRRAGVQAWHGSPRHPVREFVGSSNAGACLQQQRVLLGLVGHTHAPAAWRAEPRGAARGVRIKPDEPVALGSGKWLLNPGAVGAPAPGPARQHWWDALDLQAPAGAWWLQLDLDDEIATWRRAPFDPRPARGRAFALDLVDRLT